MAKISKNSAFFAFVLPPLVCLSGCFSRSQPAVEALPIAADAGQQAVASLHGKDNTLTMKDMEKAPGLRKAVPRIKKLGGGRSGPPSADKLKDVTVTADDINARIQEWKDSKTGRMSVAVQVNHKGKPLEGATVKFVPEPFLGPGLLEGTGTTDKHGFAGITSPKSNPTDVDGMSPGFYRVEITKAGENIPAKYNTQTTLGQEVAPDADGIFTGGVKFDLEY